MYVLGFVYVCTPANLQRLDIDRCVHTSLHPRPCMDVKFFICSLLMQLHLTGVMCLGGETVRLDSVGSFYDNLCACSEPRFASIASTFALGISLGRSAEVSCGPSSRVASGTGAERGRSLKPFSFRTWLKLRHIPPAFTFLLFANHLVIFYKDFLE